MAVPVANNLKHLPQPEVSERAAKMINELFDELRAIYPAWKAAFTSDADYQNARRVWLETIVSQRLTPRHIDYALAIAKTDENRFLPSIGQFVAWCKQGELEILGLPSEDELRERIEKFMAYGMTEVDKFTFKSDLERYLITGLWHKTRAENWNEKQLRSGIRKELTATAEKIKAGWQAPKPYRVLPEKVKIKATDEQVANYIAKMRTALGRSQPSLGVN
ncbi:hypothetical protein A4G18_00550 [Pasteurellaceae bacterium Pebbles2]|nr:hypothetical protein [Pasteurellaceae bacterium Pebbles2]